MSGNEAIRRAAHRLAAVVTAVLALACFVRAADVEERTFQRGNLVLPTALKTKRLGPVEYEKVTWKEIAEDVFRRAGVRVVFDVKDGPGSSRDENRSIASVKSTHGRFHSLLGTLFRGTVMPDCRIDDKGVFHVIPPLKGSGIAGREDLDTRTFWVVEDKVPVRALLERVFAEANLPYEIAPEVTGTTSMNYRGVIFRRALIGILNATSGGPELTYRVEDGKFFIYPLAPSERGRIADRLNQPEAQKD